jgi:hypothetical protein
MDSFGLNKETSGTLSDVDFAVVVVWHECTGFPMHNSGVHSDDDEMTIGTEWNRRVIETKLTRILVDQPISPYRRARKCDPPHTSRS